MPIDVDSPSARVFDSVTTYRGIVMARRILLAVASLAAIFAVQARAEQHRASILDGSVAVQAAGYVSYPIKVDASVMLNPRVMGHVQATGGTGNDIEVVVLSETQFINWKNGHKGGSLYTSGQITT